MKKAFAGLIVLRGARLEPCLHYCIIVSALRKTEEMWPIQ